MRNLILTFPLFGLLLLSCTDEHSSEHIDGLMVMQLTSAVGTTTYELQNANFIIQGGNGVYLNANGNSVDAVELDLALGQYSVTLQNNWEMRRSTTDGSMENVPAVLINENLLN